MGKTSQSMKSQKKEGKVVVRSVRRDLVATPIVGCN